MKGIDARNQSDSNKAALIKQQMKRIENAIIAATKKGLYEVMIYETVYTENRDQLQEDGFQIYKRGGRMGENNSLIQWGAAKEEDTNNDNYNAYYPASSTPRYPL